MLIFKKRGYKRKNPFYKKLELDEQIIEAKESEKRVTCIQTTNDLHPSERRKKWSFSEFADSSTFATCPKPTLIEDRCKKVATRSKFHPIEEDVVDNTIDDDNFDEVDGEMSVDGDESVKTDIESRENEEGSNISIDLYQNERLQKMKSDHTLSQIPPTERKKWPQKECVCCRKYGVRRDTRYICSLCNAALCKEPCFSDYHCSK